MRNKLILVVAIMAFSLVGCSKKDESADAAATMDANTSVVQDQNQTAPGVYNNDSVPLANTSDTAQADQNATANSSDLGAIPAPGTLQDVNGSTVQINNNASLSASDANNTTSFNSTGNSSNLSNNSTEMTAPAGDINLQQATPKVDANQTGALPSDANSALKVTTALKSQSSDESIDDQDQADTDGSEINDSSTNDDGLAPVDAD